MIGGIQQLDAELLFDAVVMDALIVVIKTAGHRRQGRLGKGDRRRRRNAQQCAGIENDVGRRGRFIIAEIIGATWRRPRDRGLQHLDDIGDVDAAENLTRLDDIPRPAGTDSVQSG